MGQSQTGGVATIIVGNMMLENWHVETFDVCREHGGPVLGSGLRDSTMGRTDKLFPRPCLSLRMLAEEGKARLFLEAVTM